MEDCLPLRWEIALDGRKDETAKGWKIAHRNETIKGGMMEEGGWRGVDEGGWRGEGGGGEGGGGREEGGERRREGGGGRVEDGG